MFVDKKRRWLIIGAVALVLVAVVLILILGRKPEAEEKPENAPRIGLCLRQYEEDPTYGQLLEASLKEAGFAVTIRDAGDDQTAQSKQVEALLDEGVVLLVIEPVIADAAEDTVSLLMEKNVPAVFVNYKPEKALAMWDKVCFVGCEDEKTGALQGQIILQTENKGDLNEDGQVSCLVISGPEDDALAKSHAQGCVDALVEEGLLVDQISTCWSDWTEADGRAQCAKALSQYGRDIEVIFCGNEAITLGALEAVRSGGWEIGSDYCLVGVGAEEKLQTHGMTGTVIRDLEGATQQVLAAAQALLDGTEAEKEYYVNLRTEMDAE